MRASTGCQRCETNRKKILTHHPYNQLFTTASLQIPRFIIFVILDQESLQMPPFWMPQPSALHVEGRTLPMDPDGIFLNHHNIAPQCPSMPSLIQQGEVQAKILPAVDNTPNKKDMEESSSLSPNESDVACGRGKYRWNSKGNTRYKRIITKNLNRYEVASSKREKSKIVREVVRLVKRNKSRFLRKDGKSKAWRELSPKETRTKVAHALRDHIRSSVPSKLHKNEGDDDDDEYCGDSVSLLDDEDDGQCGGDSTTCASSVKKTSMPTMTSDTPLLLSFPQSFPGNTFGVPSHTVAFLLQHQQGGRAATGDPTQYQQSSFHNDLHDYDALGGVSLDREPIPQPPPTCSDRQRFVEHVTKAEEAPWNAYLSSYAASSSTPFIPPRNCEGPSLSFGYSETDCDSIDLDHDDYNNVFVDSSLGNGVGMTPAMHFLPPSDVKLRPYTSMMMRGASERPQVVAGLHNEQGCMESQGDEGFGSSSALGLLSWAPSTALSRRNRSQSTSGREQNNSLHAFASACSRRTTANNNSWLMHKHPSPAMTIGLAQQEHHESRRIDDNVSSSFETIPHAASPTTSAFREPIRRQHCSGLPLSISIDGRTYDQQMVPTQSSVYPSSFGEFQNDNDFLLFQTGFLRSDTSFH